MRFEIYVKKEALKKDDTMEDIKQFVFDAIGDDSLICLDSDTGIVLEQEYLYDCYRMNSSLSDEKAKEIKDAIYEKFNVDVDIEIEGTE